MKVAGGVYAERCIAPPSEVMLGSAGRACLALRDQVPVELHTFHPDEEDVRANFGTNAVVHPTDELISFDYLHPLARPRITPVPLPVAGCAKVAGELVLRFGCLEGTFKVDADTAVFDPQNGRRSESFGSNGSRAKRLAIVLNSDEALALSGADAVDQAGKSLRRMTGAEVVVVKEGAAGASVFDGRGCTRVPAYRTASIYKIGSGDVFSAQFALLWGANGVAPAEAADAASRQVAAYVSTRRLPCPIVPPPASPAQARRLDAKVGVVVDGSDTSAIWLIHAATEALQGLGATVSVVGSSPDNLLANDAVLALARDERGIAVRQAAIAAAAGLPVVLYAEHPSTIAAAAAMGFKAVTDLAAAAYAAVWAS